MFMLYFYYNFFLIRALNNQIKIIKQKKGTQKMCRQEAKKKYFT